MFMPAWIRHYHEPTLRDFLIDIFYRIERFSEPREIAYFIDALPNKKSQRGAADMLESHGWSVVTSNKIKGKYSLRAVLSDFVLSEGSLEDTGIFIRRVARMYDGLASGWEVGLLSHRELRYKFRRIRKRPFMCSECKQNHTQRAYEVMRVGVTKAYIRLYSHSDNKQIVDVYIPASEADEWALFSLKISGDISESKYKFTNAVGEGDTNALSATQAKKHVSRLEVEHIVQAFLAGIPNLKN
jgi:hypothetical protein